MAGTTPITLELDLRAAYLFSELYVGDMDLDDEPRLRWIYDLYLDVAEAVKGAFGEGTGLRMIESIKFRLGVFSDLESWLEREVMGQRFQGTVVVEGRRRILAERVPRWHLA